MSKQALNSTRMKQRNYSRFLRELRFTPMTRAQVARIMGLSRAAAGIIAEELLNAGILREGPLAVEGHYSSKALFWNAYSFHIAGVNLGRDSMKVGLIDFCGKVIDTATFPNAEFKNSTEAVGQAALTIKRMLRMHAPAGKLLGVGVASPGPLDTESGVIINPPGFDLVRGCPVVPLLRERLHCGVYLENDANALAMAERYYGLRNRSQSFMELLVDMGIGAALILNGRLHQGPQGLGNGFGHTSINFDGPTCDCGNNGCVERYASIPRIIEEARKLDNALVSWETIVNGAYDGDKPASEIMCKEINYLATLIVNASNVMDIEAVIFAGEHILYRPQMLLEGIEKAVNSKIASRGERSVAILPSQIPDNAKILSCTNLVIEKFVDHPFGFKTFFGG